MTRSKIHLLLPIVILMSIELIMAQNKSIVKENLNVFLNKFTNDYIKGMLEVNPKIFTQYYADDIRLMPAFQQTLLGKENALIYHKAFFDRFEILDYKRENIEILDLGTQLSVIGTFEMDIQLKSTKKTEKLKGKYLNIWKKEKNRVSLISEI
ncbi:YybH family protein [Aquimarina sp. SS2-1]|uniref:YybH family protein n=1 Tax=Aquimarina besae TaxID=3342247 RepID=UPI003672BD39